MEESIEKVAIERITREGKKKTEDIITTELPLTIILNNQELVTLLCSPTNLKYLAIGFLFSEGLISSKDEIKKTVVDSEKGVVRVETSKDREVEHELLFKRLITSGCGRGASFYSAADVQGELKTDSRLSLSAGEIFTLAKEFQHQSQLYRQTGGVHSSALCDSKNILVFGEDIGRHNAIDKVFGECIVSDIPTADRIIITSGRISSEIVLKVARRKIPVLISKSAATSLGVKLARELGITLIGFVRGERMNAYTHGWRITPNNPTTTLT